MPVNQAKIEAQKREFTNEYVKMNGRDCSHLIVTGTTGWGKTTVLFWLIDAIVRYCIKSLGASGKQETIVWYDSRKSSEALTLLTMWNVRFLIPKGCKLTINIRKDCKYKLHEYEIIEMDNPMLPWQYVRKGWINVICLKPYVLDPGTVSYIIGKYFRSLVEMAHNKLIPVPMALFLDEFQRLAPATNHNRSGSQVEATQWIEENIQTVRSLEIRIIAVSHQPSEVARSIRKEFSWQLPRRGTCYTFQDEPRLARFNKTWGFLDKLDLIFVRPDRTFSDVIGIDFYPLAEEEIGEMIYDGIVVREDKIIITVGQDKKTSVDPLPCDTCKLAHELDGTKVICKDMMKIYELDDIREKGCTDKEAKA